MSLLYPLRRSGKLGGNLFPDIPVGLSSIVLAVQLPLGLFLLWWARYKHNLSMPSIVKQVIGRRFLV